MLDRARIKIEYPDLSHTFFRGTLIGQIRSVFKARFDRPGKVVDFKKAIEAGDVTLDASRIPNPERTKLTTLGIDIPDAEPAGSSDEPADDAPALAGKLPDSEVE